MSFRLNPLAVVLLVVAACAGIVVGLSYLRDRRTATPADLLEYLPPEQAVVLGVDLAALRSNGILEALGGSKMEREPEYVSFVAGTGFDYQQDLDYAVAWIGNGTTLMLLRGRFDWGKLRDYAAAQGGVCRNSFCRMEGSTPDRSVSFFPLRRDVMALGVGPDDWAASRLLARKSSAREHGVPARPLWVLLPSAVLREREDLPTGTRLFARTMADAEQVSLALALSNGGAVIELDATCPSAGQASALSDQLSGLTSLLKGMIAREHQAPNPRDLSGVLAAGVFNRVDRRVLGRWPVGREFLEGILRDPQ
ncbi:MAG: hypothetical protein IT159_11975 [Bryobacterales bacterium]|nr:hypothetical protein [Bryobacterales bacterium]